MTKRLICLAALAATLAGCAASSGTAPKVLPAASAAGAKAAGTTGDATTASSTGEAAAVEAAVRHYFAVANQALATGDVQPLEALSLPGCGCRSLVKEIQREYSIGRPEGARIIVESVKVHDLTTGTAGAEVVVDVPAYRELNDTAQVVANYPANRSEQDLSLELVSTRWLVSNGVDLG